MARAYNNEQRAEAARETRARILAAAYDLLTHASYASFSIAALAEKAGVSPQTIYNSIGGKSVVLKACYDVTLAGDDEPVAMSDRPQFRAMFEAADGGAFLRAYAEWCRVVSERVGPILAPLYAAGDERGIGEFFRTIERERRIGTTHAITALRDRHGLCEGLELDPAIDATWTLNSPEIWDRLTRRCGWTADDYQRWLERQLRAALL
ncbi:TetR/AcrR family transcriptional regulator [Ammonicoccus fulvus]|uniref:TetR/AcrR family transcriptional regulator n=1 Tax=Ammonicoccus fulvus TaxID=3138240 RepID=A0ABZ3FM21_9ACTN